MQRREKGSDFEFASPRRSMTDILTLLIFFFIAIFLTRSKNEKRDLNFAICHTQKNKKERDRMQECARFKQFAKKAWFFSHFYATITRITRNLRPIFTLAPLFYGVYLKISPRTNWKYREKRALFFLIQLCSPNLKKFFHCKSNII